MEEPFAEMNLNKDNLASNKALARIYLKDIPSDNYKVEVVLRHADKEYEISRCSSNPFRIISNQGLLCSEEKNRRRKFSVAVHNEEGITIPEDSTNIIMSPLNTGQVSSGRLLSGLHNKLPHIYFNGDALQEKHGKNLLVQLYMRPIDKSEMKEERNLIKASKTSIRRKGPKKTQIKKSKSSGLSVPLRAKFPFIIIGKEDFHFDFDLSLKDEKEVESKILEKDIQTEDMYQPVEDIVMIETPKEFEVDMISKPKATLDYERIALDKIDYEACEKDDMFYIRMNNEIKL